MHETTPEVFLIGGPQMYLSQIEKYLDRVGPGAVAWIDRVLREPAHDGERLAEFGGRLCYRSWQPKLNPNVNKIRSDSKEYMVNILESRHGSVLEHSMYNFVFHNVSRVFTHELITHRVGTAKSQESLRFVRLTELGFRIPEILEPMRDKIISLVEQLEEFQIDAAKALGLDDDGVPFHVKKEATSALRRLAPIGLSTGVMWSANLRTLRFCIEARTALGAEEEIRFVFDKVGQIMKSNCPNVFQDFERDDDGTWHTDNQKV